MKGCLLAGALLLMSGAVWAEASAVPAKSLTSAKPQIIARDAWVREVPPVSPAAALFVTLHNAGAKAVAITKMSSPVAERVEWHDMIMADGHMRMSQRHVIELPVGDTTLAPGASHLMLLNLRQPLRVGDSVPVRLSLANGEVLALNATVRATQPNKQAPHEH